ncbi:hypothetical protein ERO13_A09G033700v2 [Gossypium hirsutum]|uniref:TLC domain-containing protein n=2 Tax=Gossypium TaxID=3633 RepID=A0A5J5U9K2_GOSBA|nr:hypothetical protein ES319_A09G037000v1 [Gossypium barbadense]KAG4182275.1 hypothetical protein ERO13_A09G033700v2 [Gossypium hirsutum]TYH01278.1 hypothetical protein ES288_A09G045400v1 [Gossypium darwinii]
METFPFSSIPNLPLFFSMFLILYSIAYSIVFRNWSPKIRPEACSCFISLFHGTPAVFLATFAIFSDQNHVLFIGHHLATLFVFITCRHVVFHGSYAILTLLILAEGTSFCQNVWTLASARRHDNQLAAKVYSNLSPYFYAFYSVVRGIFGPFVLYQMGVFYSSGVADNVIPRWLWISWMCVVITAIGVSILWISNLWVELFKEKKAKLEKEL